MQILNYTFYFTEMECTENMAKPNNNYQEFGTVTGNSAKLFIYVIQKDIIWGSFVQ